MNDRIVDLIDLEEYNCLSVLIWLRLGLRSDSEGPSSIHNVLFKASGFVTKRPLKLSIGIVFGREIS
ncbi:hypothetical protein ACSS6N_25190 [Peribacillus frigoritolerans]|uniref:hypothetical protein n=1 Tax=Peribacillus frigoritolerans TaxID=450367 RepID=UPI003F876A51